MEMIDGLVLTYIANALWMTCLVAAAAVLLGKMIRLGPSVYRHVLWVVALACASLLPLGGLRSNASRGGERAGTFTAAPNATESSTGGVPLTSPESLWLKMRHRNRPVSFAPLLTQILASGYLGFVFYRGLCLCWAWRRTRVIVRSTSRCCFPPLQGVIVERCCSSFGLRNVHIACSRELHGPVVLGVRYPALVLPEWFVANGSEEELASALCHELAHIRRRDFLLNLVYEALLLPISLHPLAWLIKKQIGQTRELACDEMAAEKLPTRAAYARSLLSISQSIASTSSSVQPSYALGLFDVNTLEERIMNLFRKIDRADKALGRAQMLFASGLLAGACLAASAFSIQIARAGSTPEELKRFAGTWEAKFKGNTFITVKLAVKEGKIYGTVGRTSIRLSDQGELTEATTMDGEDTIAETVPDGKVLHLATKAKGQVSTMTGDSEESIRYDMRLTGSGQAELQIAGAPPGMPAPAPWKLERKAANP